MANRFVILLFALFASCNAHDFFNSRIVGGADAPPGLAPWAVSLRSGLLVKSHFCGATIITPKFVVTAAHCIDAVWSNSIIGGGLSNSLQVLSGTLLQNSGGVKTSVKQNFTHQAWDSRNIKNDIGILELVNSLVMDDAQKVIPVNPALIGGEVQLTAVGWGLTKYPSISPPNAIKYLVTPSMSHEDCKAARDQLASETSGFFPDISTGEICTLHSIGQAVCQGDSGSALFDDEGLVGIVSWGVACAKGAPDVFTRVSSYVDWIDAIIQ